MASASPPAPVRNYRRAARLIEQHWSGESTALVRDSDSGRTHLITVESLAVLRALSADGPMQMRQIAHAAGVEGELDEALAGPLQGIIEGLIQAGLVLECADGGAGSRSPC